MAVLTFLFINTLACKITKTLSWRTLLILPWEIVHRQAFWRVNSNIFMFLLEARCTNSFLLKNLLEMCPSFFYLDHEMSCRAGAGRGSARASFQLPVASDHSWATGPSSQPSPRQRGVFPTVPGFTVALPPPMVSVVTPSSISSLPILSAMNGDSKVYA